MARFYGSHLDKKAVDRVVLRWLTELPDTFAVFVGLEGGDFQVDLLVLKANGIFNIAARNWPVRRVQLDADWDLDDGTQMTSPMISTREQSDRVAKYLFLQRQQFLAERVQEVLEERPTEFKVFPVVAVSNPKRLSTVPVHRYFKIVLRGDDLRKHLEKYEWEFDTPAARRRLVLDAEAVPKLAGLLGLAEVDPKSLAPIGDPASASRRKDPPESHAGSEDDASEAMSVDASPYQYTYTVTGNDFYGRERELGIIGRALTSDPPRPVLIQGLQRTGKSSLAVEGINRFVASHTSCIVLRFDFRRLWQEGLKPEEDIALELLTQLVSQQDGGEDRLRQNYNDVKDIIDQRRLFLGALRAQRSRGRKVILLLDECQDIAPALVEQKHQSFFRLIESLCRDDSYSLRLVMACRPAFLELEPIKQMNLARLCVNMMMGPLDEAAALPIIERGARVLRFSEDAKRRILRITGSHPYWVQFLCHQIFERWVFGHAPQAGRALVNEAFVDETFEEIVIDPASKSQFYLLYQEVENNPNASRLLRHIAKKIPKEGGPVLVSDLGQEWRDEATLRAALKPLRDNLIVAVEDVPQAPAVRFRVEALGRWMRPNLITE